MKRREFIKKGIALTGGALLSGAELLHEQGASAQARTVENATTNQTGGWYTQNRAPLQPSPFMTLPVGSITPKGWLKHQLNLQVNGLNGRMEEVSDYLKFEGNGWINPNSDTGWEEVTYWLRGFADLGYVTGDARIQATTKKWLSGILDSQQPDGWFGPKAARHALDGLPDFWPHMPVLYALRTFQEVTGDARVIPFLTKYFQFQNKQPAEVFGKGWGAFRWGDNMDSVFWLYNRTGDAFLLDLARKSHVHSADYVNTIPTPHNVNFAQGFREPAQYGVLAKDVKLLQATEQNYAKMMEQYGQVAGGGFGGDENVRHGYGDPRQGFETCGIVEYMLSFEILTRLSGNPRWSDLNEELAFNSMPAAFDPEQKGTHYITSANSIQLDPEGKKHHQFGNGDMPMQTYQPGIHNYRCCPHNYGMGWPYYAENLWLATADKGLCASLYAASEVKAKVGDGTKITFAQTTEYPFSDTIQLTLSAPKSVTFPLYLRVPGWCQKPSVQINGKAVRTQGRPQSYLILEREWQNGDVVTLRLPMQTTVRTWTKNKNSVSVDHGPITYSLAIQEKWEKYAGTAQWPEYAVYPASAWNYGLILDKGNPSRSFQVVQKNGPVAANPFTHETAPIELRAKARRISAWKADEDNVIDTLKLSPVRSDAPVETVTLIPMGAARLRITSFPTIGSGQDAHEWADPLTATASFVFRGDSVQALYDERDPANSDDDSIPRFTWWDHKATAEWVQYDFPKPVRASSVSVYWFDDTGKGECRVPHSWRLLYKDGGAWKPVENASSYGVEKNQYNKTTFTPVTTSALRLEAQLQPGVSGGILRWRVDRK